MSEQTIPGGIDKGKRVSEVSDKSLAYWAQNAKNTALQDACVAEQRRRGSSGAPAPRAAAPSQAVERTAPARSNIVLEGSFGDATKATAALQHAASQYHLVSPATVCGSLPEGCDVTLSLVHIDSNDRSLYPLPGGLKGLDRVALAKIAAAAGATTVSSERLDDGSHPHYCAWRVVIAYRLFDGQLVQRQGSVEIDVREPDGAAYEEIVRKAEDSRPPRDPSGQLLELRKFLTRHAESKAMNRAIAAMGIKRSYTVAELAKPFAVARLQFTGRSEDPQARAEFRSAIAQSFLGSTQQLYGGSPQQVAHHSVPQQFAPPSNYGRHSAFDTEGDDAPPTPRPATRAPHPDPEAADVGVHDIDRGDSADAY